MFSNDDSITGLAAFLNFGRLVVGGLFSLFGFGWLMYAMIVGDDFWFDLIVGVITLTVGMALIAVPPLEAEKLEKLRKTFEP